jgi:glycosyltransferase involved in cell wall biosynthesis
MGGVKVVHEYANRLTKKGHEVTLLYSLRVDNSFTTSSKYYLRKIYDKITGVKNCLYYQPLPKVNVLVVKKVISKYVPEGDAIIVVGWQTAESVNNLPGIHGKKFYLLQSFETYFRNKKEVLKTYHLPMQKIAISRWILNELEKLGESGYGPLGNAIDSKEFFLIDPNKKRPYHVMMLYHHHKIKGATEGINAFEMAKKKFPNLKAVFISSRKPLHKIPDWIEVKIRPPVEELRNLYNSSRIFLHPSFWEGWSLPPMEAIACGCAVVGFNNLGVQEYLKDGFNALLSPLGNVEALSNNILKLLQNDDLYSKIVANGIETVKKYNWDSIVSNFEEILINNL